ncbi:PIF1-like helicase [Medicago truncatula]|uniref:PIF1-like helicase n=1 Tax=Medicago truncatula TaxID=3880 RepID=G7KLL1_MEDTR|nr:PIF1-like helicase [Medicago truncatula]
MVEREFINSTAQGSIPPHILKVKKGAPLMLLRNIDPRYGLCNGTQLLCHGLFKNIWHTIPNVGIYLPHHVFSHGQLYVALSRGVCQNSTKVLIKEGKIEGEDEDFTKNVVFKDILLSQSYQCFFYITCHLYIYL